MLALRELKTLFQNLARSRRQPFKVDVYCGVRAQLMMLEAVIDWNIDPEQLSFINLISVNSAFQRPPVPPDAFDFSTACQNAGQTQFTRGDYLFSLHQFPDGAPCIRITNRDGSGIKAGNFEVGEFLWPVQGVAPYFEHWALLVQTKKGPRVIDPHVADGPLTIKKWIQTCGVSRALTLVSPAYRELFSVEVNATDRATLDAGARQAGITVPTSIPGRQMHLDGLAVTDTDRYRTFVNDLKKLAFGQNFSANLSRMNQGPLAGMNLDDRRQQLADILKPFCAYEEWMQENAGLGRRPAPGSAPNRAP